MKTDSPVLRRLGPVPFWRGGQRCLAVLEPIYRRAMERSRVLLGRLPSSGAERDGREAT